MELVSSSHCAASYAATPSVIVDVIFGALFDALYRASCNPSRSTFSGALSTANQAKSRAYVPLSSAKSEG